MLKPSFSPKNEKMLNLEKLLSKFNLSFIRRGRPKRWANFFAWQLDFTMLKMSCAILKIWLIFYHGFLKALIWIPWRINGLLKWIVEQTQRIGKCKWCMENFKRNFQQFYLCFYYKTKKCRSYYKENNFLKSIILDDPQRNWLI